MLDQIIENINEKIRKEVLKPEMESISLNYIMSRNIPEFIKHFFNQEVEIWLREEGDKFTAGERFSYDAPEIQMYIDKILDLLKQTATFPLNQFNRLLERSVKLEASYLVRPHQTLTQFLFKDNFVITTIEVYDMLRYFEKFLYYKKAFTEYFNIKYMQEISQTQFEELIDGVDKQLFSKNPLEMAMETTRTIIEFLNEGRTENQDVIPLDILLSAYSDRKLYSYSELVSREQANGTTELTLASLEQILGSGKTLAELEPTTVVTEIPSEEIENILEKEPEVELDSIEVSEEIVYPQEQFTEEETEEEYEDEEIEEEAEEREEAGVEAVAEQVEAPPAGAETEVEKEIAEEAPFPEKETPQAAPVSAADELASLMGERMKGDHLEDLKKLITPKLRKKFIKKIFRKKEEKYQNFMSQINQIDSWREASSLIDDYFTRESVNPYSKEALEFSDIIYNRYYPKDISANKGDF